MTEYSLMVAVILAVAVAVVAYRVIHGILKVAVLAVAVASVALGIAAFLVVMDANNVREGFGRGKNLVVVVDGTTAVFAMELRGENNTEVINEQEIDEYSKMIGAGDYDAVRDGYYKLVIISTKMAEGNDTAAKHNYRDKPDEFFVSLAEKAFSDPLFFVSEYKKGNIEVYEETALFRAVKVFPAAVIKSAAGKAIKKVKVAAVDKIEG